MVTGTHIVINRSVRINQETGKLEVTKSFAEKNLSESALKLAEKTKTHYMWEWGRTAAVVLFELPKLFNSHFPEVMRNLINYCFSYVEENRLTDSVIYTRYLDNYKRELQ